MQTHTCAHVYTHVHTLHTLMYTHTGTHAKSAAGATSNQSQLPLASGGGQKWVPLGPLRAAVLTGTGVGETCVPAPRPQRTRGKADAQETLRPIGPLVPAPPRTSSPWSPTLVLTMGCCLLCGETPKWTQSILKAGRKPSLWAGSPEGPPRCGTFRNIHSSQEPPSRVPQFPIPGLLLAPPGSREKSLRD